MIINYLIYGTLRSLRKKKNMFPIVSKELDEKVGKFRLQSSNLKFINHDESNIKSDK